MYGSEPARGPRHEDRGCGTNTFGDVSLTRNVQCSRWPTAHISDCGTFAARDYEPFPLTSISRRPYRRASNEKAPGPRQINAADITINSNRAIHDSNNGMYPTIPESFVATTPPKQRRGRCDWCHEADNQCEAREDRQCRGDRTARCVMGRADEQCGLQTAGTTHAKAKE